ncbi:hypothetical protein LXA43DRAFT_1036364 [Ganoderma leucocontextum]|nr:hypothetical protein LXA43DRAFT_1036364 [Ganoderma leucocontextum]
MTSSGGGRPFWVWVCWVFGSSNLSTPTMPERTEIYVQHRQLLHFLSNTNPEERILEQIWVDPLLAEMPKAVNPRARQGLVYPITESTNVRRKGLYVHPSSSLLGCDFHTTPYVLSGSRFHPDSLLLEFQEQVADNSCPGDTQFVCKINLLLHTSIQIFSPQEWDFVKEVPRSVRGFKVGVAFGLTHYIVAFLTKDILFLIRWSTRLSDLPGANIPDVVQNWDQFLQGVADWVIQRRKYGRNADQPAWISVHESPCFPGLGVYSESEVFHRAGLSFDLPASALLASPARIARLCLAWRAVAIELQGKVMRRSKWFSHGFKVAIERSQRQHFANLLKVYGKTLTWITEPLGILLHEANHRVNRGLRPQYDLFDPTLVRTALECDSHSSLGHLVFGKEWASLAAKWGLQCLSQTPSDPLTKIEQFWECLPTHLKPDFYYTFSLTRQNSKSRRAPTTMYRFSLQSLERIRPQTKAKINTPRTMRTLKSNTTGKLKGAEADAKEASPRTFQAWTIFPCVPRLEGVRNHLKREPPATQAVSTLRYMILHGKYYTVGPTDFCGVARIVRAQGGGLPWLMLCEEDPSVPPFYRARHQCMEKHLKTHYKLALTRRISQVIKSTVSPRMAAVTGPRRKKLKQSHKRKPDSTAPPRRPPRTADDLALEYGLEVMRSLH